MTMQLFISYSRIDKVLAQKLADDLGKQGYPIWLDVRSIPHGANWDSEVQRGLDTSDVMIVMLSPASAASQNVADEWSYFIERGKRILPVMISQCDVPFRLSRRQRVDFIQGYDQGLTELLHALNEPPEDVTAGSTAVPLPAPKPAPPAAAPVVGSASSPVTTPPGRQPSAAVLDSQPTLIIRPETPLPVAWADRYAWWRGLTPQVATGDSLVRGSEWRLMGYRRLPLVVPLDNILSACIVRTTWDTYLRVSFRDSAGETHELILSDPDRASRAATVSTLFRTLVQATGRPLN